MHCNNPDHHMPDNRQCDTYGHQHHGHHSGPNPHDGHYHLNKNSVRGWVATAVYLSLHATQIYLILKLI